MVQVNGEERGADLGPSGISTRLARSPDLRWRRALQLEQTGDPSHHRRDDRVRLVRADAAELRGAMLGESGQSDDPEDDPQGWTF